MYSNPTFPSVASDQRELTTQHQVSQLVILSNVVHRFIDEFRYVVDTDSLTTGTNHDGHARCEVATTRANIESSLAFREMIRQDLKCMGMLKYDFNCKDA